jgi:hypothetical protein
MYKPRPRKQPFLPPFRFFFGHLPQRPVDLPAAHRTPNEPPQPPARSLVGYLSAR